jgi:hypothetical protein
MDDPSGMGALRCCLLIRGAVHCEVGQSGKQAAPTAIRDAVTDPDIAAPIERLNAAPFRPHGCYRRHEPASFARLACPALCRTTDNS